MGERQLGKTVLLILMGVALALRWCYVREISLFVDEFVTIWAARNVLVKGLPIFPSGNLYPHGFVFSYLQAPFVTGEFNETLARVAALVLSLAIVPVTYWIGRRLFSEPVGLLAAAALAVDPDCIIWGGRARMYGLLQLLVLMVVYFAYQGLVRDRPRDRYLAMGLLVVAIFTHAEAILLLLVLGMTAFVVWPWRHIVRKSVTLPFALGVFGALAFVLVSIVGQPGHLETLQQSRPYLTFPVSLPDNLEAFAAVLTRVHRLPFALLAVAGLLFPLYARAGVDGEEWGHSPLSYLYTVWILFLTLFLLLAGPGWQNERYLFLLLPLLFLIGGAVLNTLFNRLDRSLRPLGAMKPGRPWRAAVLALLVALFVGLTGSRTAYVQEPGYDLAFRYLRERWSPGDRGDPEQLWAPGKPRGQAGRQPEVGEKVVTFSPPAAMLYLGQCDYFAIQRGYDEYVVPRPSDGRPADLWTATPLLRSTAGFVELLASAPRVWFVIDEWRFQTRYEPGFILMVLDSMDLVYREREVMIFRSDGYTTLASPAVKHKRKAGFGGELLLTGFDLSQAGSALKPGDGLDVTLHWQAIEPTDAEYFVTLSLVGPDGSREASTESAVLRGLYHPSFWSHGETIPDRHRLALPSGLAPGNYHLHLGLYHAGQPERPLDVEGHDYLALHSFPLDLGSP